MVERPHTSKLPDADPYNATQPAPPVAQGIAVYITSMVYSRVGIAILEDRDAGFKLLSRRLRPALMDFMQLKNPTPADNSPDWGIAIAGGSPRLCELEFDIGKCSPRPHKIVISRFETESE